MGLDNFGNFWCEHGICDRSSVKPSCSSLFWESSVDASRMSIDHTCSLLTSCLWHWRCVSRTSRWYGCFSLSSTLLSTPSMGLPMRMKGGSPFGMSKIWQSRKNLYSPIFVWTTLRIPSVSMLWPKIHWRHFWEKERGLLRKASNTKDLGMILIPTLRL
jgi:hypothetical protein